MSLSPRTLLLAAALAFYGLTSAPRLHAQQQQRTTRQRTPPLATKQPAKAARTNDPEQKRRRLAADSIIEATESARDIENPYYRINVLALAADALWTFDEPAARTLFTRAWDATTAFNKEQASNFDSNPRGSNSRGVPDFSGDVPEAFTAARQELLGIAARNDARLTERLIEELRESVESQRSKDARRTGDVARRHDLEDSIFSGFDFEQMRLNISRTLIDEGEFKQAAAIVAPEIRSGVSSALVRFLIQFRETAPAEADALYMSLLAKAASDPNANANDVLLLSSYIFTPRLLAVVDASGSVNFNTVYREGGAELTPVGASAQTPASVRQSFFDVAAGILLRPSMPRASDAASARAQAAAQFFAVTRLLPFFDRDAPGLAPQMRARQQALAAELESASRDSLARLAKTDNLTPTNPPDPVGENLDYLKGVQSAESRDEARARFVTRAARLKLWNRARTVASEIEDADKRAAALKLIEVFQVATVGDAFSGDVDGDVRAAAFVQNADVPPLTRAFGYAQAALLSSRMGEKARAAELLGRAQIFAEQTDTGTEERLVALLVVAATAEQFDAARAWTLVPAIIQAANDVRNVSPDEISGRFKAPTLNTEVEKALSEELSDFRLDEFFASMSKRDFARALSQARAFSNATTRAIVVISVARAVLAKSPSTRQTHSEVLRPGKK